MNESHGLLYIATLLVVLYALIAYFIYDMNQAYSEGYLQGQIDQAAIQKELREGICTK